ncbi:UDP-arabinose 4-epimerase 1-like protein [Tanacetum coccineum]
MAIKPVPDGDPIPKPELTGESPRRKIPESPWGSPIPIGDGDGDVNRFPDGDGDGDGDEAEKRGWGWVPHWQQCVFILSIKDGLKVTITCAHCMGYVLGKGSFSRHETGVTHVLDNWRVLAILGLALAWKHRCSKFFRPVSRGWETFNSFMLNLGDAESSVAYVWGRVRLDPTKVLSQYYIKYPGGIGGDADTINPITPYRKDIERCRMISFRTSIKIQTLRFMILDTSIVIGSDPEGQISEAPRPELREHGRISGYGTCIRDYIDVTDLVDAHVKALENAKPGHVGIYNVGTGKGRSVKEFVEACKKATGVSIKVEYLPRRPGDYAEVFSDPSKILRELNWSAQFTDLEKSLQVAWKWQKSHHNGYGPMKTLI